MWITTRRSQTVLHATAQCEHSPRMINTQMTIEPAREEDWAWILQLHAQTAWESLAPERQAEVNKETVTTRIADQVTKSRVEHGTSNQAFVARDLAGNCAGFVWIDQIRSSFTGKSQAYLLDIVVLESYRRQGLGRLLMAEAEAWAKQKGFDRVGLNVAAHNVAAIDLYNKLGYKTETVKMWKKLGEQPSRTLRG